MFGEIEHIGFGQTQLIFVWSSLINYLWDRALEVVSKPQITFESKASRGLKAERTR